MADVSLFEYPGLVRVKVAGSRPPVGGGIRKPIYFFSRASRYRLLQKLACIDWAKLSTKVAFVTLTFSDENVSHFRENFRRFRRRLYQRVLRGSAPSWAGCYVWKFEYGERGGRPHFHLMFPLYDGKMRIRDVLAPIWGLGFVWAETVSPKRVLRYLSKYVGKGLSTGRGGALSSSLVPVDPSSSLDLAAYRIHLEKIRGRFWGVSGREYLQATLRACNSFVV